jgi:hypothetical protein
MFHISYFLAYTCHYFFIISRSGAFDYRICAAFFDLAEIKAKEHTKMTMADWVAELDKFAENFGKGVLKDAGKVSNKQALEKAVKEYRKYQAKTLSPVEEAYLESIKVLEKKIEKTKNK